MDRAYSVRANGGPGALPLLIIMIKLILNIQETDDGCVTATGGLLHPEDGGHTPTEMSIGLKLLQLIEARADQIMLHENISKYHVAVNDPDHDWTDWCDKLPPGVDNSAGFSA